MRAAFAECAASSFMRSAESSASDAPDAARLDDCVAVFASEAQMFDRLAGYIATSKTLGRPPHGPARRLWPLPRTARRYRMT